MPSHPSVNVQKRNRMSNNALSLAQEFLNRMGSGAEPAEVAALFSRNPDREIAVDTGALPWIGKKSGRAAIVGFVRDSRATIERITFDVLTVAHGEIVRFQMLKNRFAVSQSARGDLGFGE
jgi:hypothetical protein